MVDDIDRKTEAIHLVEDRQSKGCIDVAFLLVAANVEIHMVGSAIGELVDEGRITVEIEDNRFVRGEQRIEVSIRHAMRVLGVRYQAKQIDHIHKAQLQCRNVFLQDAHCRQCFHRGNITGAGQDDIGFLARIGAGPIPDSDALGAVIDSRIHIEKCECGCLSATMTLK